MTTEFTVVVVEDEPSIAYLESEVLEEAGFKVESFALGQAALDRLAEGKADLIVLDYFLPDMNGSEFVAALAGGAADLPILAVSGHSDPRVIAALKNAGVLEYIVKDPSLKFLDELPKAVRTALAPAGGGA